MTASSQYAIAENTAGHIGGESEIHRLQAENIALQSILHGLCMGLSQISELHREVIIQACDYANRTPESQGLKRGEKPGVEAFDNVVERLRTAILDRCRSY